MKTEENLKHVYLSSIEFFKEYLKKEFRKIFWLWLRGRVDFI
jgi:hypothetical protein